MEEYIELKIPGNPKMLCLVRQNVNLACRMVGFDERQVNGITLAVDEGCTNIIRHCYGGDTKGVIVVRLRLYADRIVIVLRDFGEGMDSKKLEKCLAKRQLCKVSKKAVRPGGLGVMLIHTVMDRVQYKTSPDFGTVLKLTKYLSDSREARGGSSD
ncbi:MAG: ATP-binding protein [Gemmatimonadota bacterium]|nr:ATP-binding protein [Gemmatimonadota bacterium]